MNRDEVQAFLPEILTATAGPVAGLLDGKLDLLKDVKVQLDTRIGRCELNIARLNQLKAGELLTLDRAPGDPVEVVLTGQVVARGPLVVAGEFFGVQIEEVAPLRA
jgi:flagellar motor switch protein FliN/FliY